VKEIGEIIVGAAIEAGCASVIVVVDAHDRIEPG